MSIKIKRFILTFIIIVAIFVSLFAEGSMRFSYSCNTLIISFFFFFVMTLLFPYRKRKDEKSDYISDLSKKEKIWAVVDILLLVIWLIIQINILITK